MELFVFDSLGMDAPLAEVTPGVFALELFHGPTLAFKDFGARFLARTMACLTRDEDRESPVLVVTTGDHGRAVAQGFYGGPGVKVCLLVPFGKVSRIKE